MLVIMFFFTNLFRAIFWFESNYEKLMPEKIEEASECVELLILQKQLKVQFFAWILVFVRRLLISSCVYEGVTQCPYGVCVCVTVWLEFQISLQHIERVQEAKTHVLKENA